MTKAANDLDRLRIRLTIQSHIVLEMLQLSKSCVTLVVNIILFHKKRSRQSRVL